MTTNMELKSLFNLKTKSGFSSIDAVKSAMQKYARRGMQVEMLQAVYEMDAFSKFDESDDINVQRAVKAIRTNMINRIKVILFEDVSFSQIGAFISVINKIKKWEDEGRTDRNTLAEIVSIISNAKKLRLPNFLQDRYGKDEDSVMTKKCFTNGIDNKKINCVEWIFHNEEESLILLEDYKFPGKKLILPMIVAEWKRMKPTKSKMGSDDRHFFIVVPWLWIMYADSLKESDGIHTSSFSKDEIAAAYDKNDIQFHDYVYDKHTKEGKSRGKTLEDFKAEGAFVTNEDTTWLSQFKELKDYYNQSEESKPKRLRQKEPKKEPKKESNVNKRLRRGNIKIDQIKEIDINVDDIDLILDGVRAGKLPCGNVRNENMVDKVIKPMNKSTNYGMDYVYIDRQKHLFGLKDLNITLGKIPGKVLVMKCVEEDKDGVTVKRKTYVWEDSDVGQVIAIMNKVNVHDDFSKCKNLFKDEAKFREMIKIRLFNGFFRISDNVTRNILVDKDNELFAIDQNDMYGKRKNVFNKKEPARKFITAKLIESVIKELDFATHEQTLIDEMFNYFPESSCKLYENELRGRVLNYTRIVLEELDLIEKD